MSNGIAANYMRTGNTCSAAITQVSAGFQVIEAFLSPSLFPIPNYTSMILLSRFYKSVTN